MKTVVVIGSNSFSGSHFVDFLLNETDYSVIGMSRSVEKNDIYLPYRWNPDSERFVFHQLDLNKDMDDIIALIEKEKPVYVVNFASQSMVGQSWDYPHHWYQTNVLSIVKLINALKDMKFLEKYVHVSTPEVYGTCSGRVKEDNPYNPSTPYAASRSAADVFIQMYVKAYKFPAVFTRAANVYGSGQQLFKIIPRSIVYMKLGKKIPLHGGGLAKRAFIHIKDVCAATKEIMEKAKPGEIYHLSTDKLHAIKDLVHEIADGIKIQYDGAVEIVETRKGLDDAYILDSTKAKEEFDWEPQIPLEKGLSEVIRWVDHNWEIIKEEQLEYVHKE